MIGKLLIACLALVQVHQSVAESRDFFCLPIHYHKLLPHEYDCTKFYYCEYGAQWVTPRDCAPGTWFSYEKQVCVHPADSDCIGISTTTTTTTSSTTTTPTTTTPTTTTPTTTTPTTTTPTTTTTTTTTSSPPPICDCNVLPWAHESRCDKFYMCVDDRVVTVQCSKGLHFNPVKGACDFTCYANCTL